ncbi:fructose-bisphosphate aldolase [Atlantibacter hermannii]|nr:fructose-bisphosphate aldolase [Atlantibacter hermannii]
MSKIFDFVKPGVVTGDDVQKIFQVAKKTILHCRRLTA